MPAVAPSSATARRSHQPSSPSSPPPSSPSSSSSAVSSLARNKKKPPPPPPPPAMEIEDLDFVHLTDFHLDPLYDEEASPATHCHGHPADVSSIGANAKTSALLPPARFGVSGSGCDSPAALVKGTLDFIRERWSGQRPSAHHLDAHTASNRSETTVNPLQFVLVTGDNSRHDRDSRNSKVGTDVISQNRKVVSLLKDTFDIRSTPVIMSIGNWDTFRSGQLPSSDKDAPTLSDLWETWSPLFTEYPESAVYAASEREEIFRTFNMGGFFSRTVVEDRLTVLSLNTLSFFVENGGVADCSPLGERSLKRKGGHGDREGDVHLDWMQEQMEQARKDGRWLILIGHVPPVNADIPQYRPNCLDGYLYLIGEYSDVILAQYFGHINKDMAHLVLAERPLIAGASENDLKKGRVGFPAPIVNPYRIVSLMPNTIPSIDLTASYIASVATTSASVIPVFHPGFRVGQIRIQTNPSPEQTAQNRSPSRSELVLLNQETWMTDLTVANEDYEKERKKKKKGDKTPVDYRLKFVPTCSSLEDFGMPEVSVDAWTDYVERMRDSMEVITGAEAVHRSDLVDLYEKCMSISFGPKGSKKVKPPKPGLFDPSQLQVSDFLILLSVLLGILLLVLLLRRMTRFRDAEPNGEEGERDPLLQQG